MKFNKLLVFTILSGVVLTLWLSTLKLKGPEWLFSMIQTIGCYFSTIYLLKFQSNKCSLFFGGAVFGWLISFFTSILIEAIYNPFFQKSLLDNVEKGSLFSVLFTWLILSFIYLGAIQGLLIMWTSIKLNPTH